MQALHEAISALGLQLFNLSFKWSEAEVCKCRVRLTHSTHITHEGEDDFLCFLFTVKIQWFRGAAWHIS